MLIKMNILRFIYNLAPKSFQNYLKQFKNSALYESIDKVLFEFNMILVRRQAKREFAKISPKSDLQLHLGCGSDVRVDWINLDMLQSQQFHPANATFIQYDLRQDIPLPDKSCKLIYSSHFWEHLDFHAGYKMMEESYRILEDGGVFRIVVPDFFKVFEAYTNGNSAYFDLIPESSINTLSGTETLLDYVHYSVYQFGEHLCLYDNDRICKMLKLAGFSKPEIVSFDTTIDIDDPVRKKYSLYVEALK